MRKTSWPALTSMLLLMLSLSGCGSGLVISSSYDSDNIEPELVDANTDFAFDLFNRLNVEDKGGNIFISPLSVSTALAMTFEGAAGETKDAMAAALNYDRMDIASLNSSYKDLIRYLREIDKKVELDIKNSIWIRSGFPVKEEFISTNTDIFDASVKSLDFSEAGAAGIINKWIDDATKGKIDKMIEPPIDSDVIMYLINAIYFKGQWTTQFDKKDTADTEFRSDGGSVTVPMMSRQGDVEYGRGEGYKAVRMPYGSGKTSMYCILPDEDIPIDTFAASLDRAKWVEIKTGIRKTEDVTLRIPRFKLEYGIKQLNDSLKDLGMGIAFGDGADFSGITDKTGICISRVLHKALIEINEEGSEAAGVTVVEMRETAMADPVTFIADRPFVFAIADDQTGTVLFIGKLCNP